MKLEFSPEAVVDLTDILDYVGRDKPKAAVKLVDGIEATCAKLAQMSMAGTARSDLYPGLRAFSHGNYVIFFLAITSDVLRIVRIMHGARDVKPEDFRLGR